VLPALLLLLAAAEPRPVALLPLRTLGVPPDVMGALAVTLRNEVSQLPEAKLVPEKELLLHLEREAGCAEKVDKDREVSTFVEVRYGEVSRARIEFGPGKGRKSEIWLPRSGVLASARCRTHAPSPV
jgi:hypothetical protein